MRAAGFLLLLFVCRAVRLSWYEDCLQRCTEEEPQRVEVVDRRKGFALLPFVDCSRLFKAEKPLQVLYRQSAFYAQATDVVSRGDEVDHGEVRFVHVCTSMHY